MRFRTLSKNTRLGIAIVDQGGAMRALFDGDDNFPGTLADCLAAGQDALSHASRTLREAPIIEDESAVQLLPPIPRPGKIICVGLNYLDHSQEAGIRAAPEFPNIFARFANSLVAHDQPILLPRVSDKLDFEGELVAVVGRPGRYIEPARALDHVAGYSIFNDGSVRDYQLRTAQWVLGKTFDRTGGFGPDFVSWDELPDGAKGLRLETRLNGAVMQQASTGDMIFDVATLVSICSEAMLLEPGDIIVTGTPAGIGHARKPPVYMTAGDICEVSIEQLGTLRNPIATDAARAAPDSHDAG
ncbi:fumarylacetoacetate hydrolase family protein [Sphingomonas sp. CGMCC 1.13654]|uniref:Fumarylacetoacetate hydrolase family protein n=1 Tax=Sphingomonas chungangi TaxID=2683589 RepID=A0A838L3G6_9SPHN|nr:fumarylacetoacetate hydrolase family protein [Sphingomonas chungangi]MBA2933470.1 fumarylacetoacetate hydrolase family protein [Sphingomonas chungangi]MVW54803.1 fumarylacetoacetate hydrolase [Sphingomonas chungangi]